jgi:plasmid maintenance system antidote protein VapI
LGLTQVELAAQLNVHPVSVARWETGARRISDNVANRVERLLSDGRRT